MIVRSIGMMTAVNVLKGVITLSLSFYIAMAVAPEEFGLIAFAIPLAALITLLTDFGVASAVVRERHLSKSQSGSAFVTMLYFGAIGGVVLALLSTPLQWAFGIGALQNVVLGFSVVASLSVWAACPRALVERELQYSTICAVELAALFVSTLCFYIAFERSWGLFALVAFHVALQGTRFLTFLWFARRLFVWVLKPRGIAPLLQTGGWLFASNLLSYASRNLDRFIVAASLGASSVGLYGFAYQFMTIPLVLLAWPASGVLVSTLSRMNDDTEGKRIVVESFIAITAAAVFPMMTFVALQSAYPLQALLSDTWRGVELYITLLAPLGAIQALAVYGTATLVANGRIKLNFGLSALNGILIPVGFLLSVSYGLLVAVITYVFASSLVCAIVLFHLCRTSHISLFLFLDLLRPGAMATILLVLACLSQGGTARTGFFDWALDSCLSILAAIVGLLLYRGRLFHAISSLTSVSVPKASVSVP